jgi:hypothetical protein
MADDVWIDRLVVELTADISEFRRALLEAIGLTEQLGRGLNDAMSRHMGAGDIINAGITAALAGAAIQASRTQIQVSGALQAIGRSAREAHEQIAAAQRAQALLQWNGPPPPPPAGGAIAAGPVAPQLPGGGAAGVPAAGSMGGSAIQTYSIGGVYQPGNRIWRIRQRDLLRAAEGTPAGSQQWRDYEEARAAAGLPPDPNVPRASGPDASGPRPPAIIPGVPTVPHPVQAPTGMTTGQAAIVARGVAAGRINHPDPRIRADGDMPRELSDSYSARLAHELETAAGMTGPPPGPVPPGREWDPRTRSWVWSDVRQGDQERALRDRTRRNVFRGAMQRSGGLSAATDAADEAIDEAMDLGARMGATQRNAREAASAFTLLRGTVSGFGRALGTVGAEVLRFGLNIVGLGILVEPILAGFGSMGAAISGAAAAATGAAAPFLLIGAAIAAFIALFVAANWDRVRALMDWLKGRVEDVLGDRWQRIVAAAQRVLAEFGGAAGALWEKIAEPLRALGAVVFPLLMGLAELAIRALDAIGAAVEGLLNILADVIGLIGALIEGDWAGVWESARGIVASFVDMVWEIFAAFFPELMDGMQGWWDGVVELIRGKTGEAQAQVQAFVGGVSGFFAGLPAAVGGFVKATVDGIQAEFGDRLAGIVDFVNQKVGEVVGFFEWAWDQIVGHSWVPDTIDGIEAEYGRLPDVMVDPAREANEAVVGSFEEARTDIDEAISETMDVVRDGVKGGLKDLLKGEFNFGDFIANIVTRIGDRAIDRAVDLLMEQIDGLLEQLEVALGDIFNGMFQNGANDNGIFSGIGRFFGSLFGGGRAGGLRAGPVLPGRIYDVGEFGREKFVPASAGYILNDNDMRGFGGGRGVVNHFHFPNADAESFQRSRGQIEAMMLRAAGRGRRMV